MVAEMRNHCITLPTFIVKLCRKFHVFPNERTTLLSQADDLQVLQYCLAYYNQQNGGDFMADSKEVLEMFEILQQSSIHQIEAEVDKVYSQLNLKAHTDSPDIHETSIQRSKTISLLDSVINDDTGIKTLDDLMDKTKIAKIFCVYQDYKKSSNHWSVLDAYFHFVQCLSDNSTDLFMSLKNNEEIDNLQIDVTDFISLQTKIIEVLNSIKESVSLSKDSLGGDVLPNIPVIFPKTPSRSQRFSHQEKEAQSPFLSKTPRTPYSSSQKREIQKLLVQDVFRSYLHLLINSRSQLAFARVFNIPERELDHWAFTHLKHEASNFGLSMYQTLSSFLRRIHLGGSGYAPASDSPLLQHVKGLGMLLDLTQKLQTVIEEDFDLQSACRRIVSIIKINLIRCKSGKFQKSMVEPEAEAILNKLLDLIKELEKNKGTSPERPVSSGGSVLGRKCVQVIQSFLDQSALTISELDHHLMSDIQMASQSPTRIPSLLTQFRSPAIVDLERECDEQDEDSIESTLAKKNQVQKPFVSSALYLDADHSGGGLLMTQGTLSTTEVVPSKTIVQFREDSTSGNKATSVSHNSNSLPVLGKATKSKGGKRLHVAALGQENAVTAAVGSQEVMQKKPNLTQSEENSPKSSRTGPGQIRNRANAKSSCRRKLLPQVKGQAKITGFFR